MAKMLISFSARGVAILLRIPVNEKSRIPSIFRRNQPVSVDWASVMSRCSVGMMMEHSSLVYVMLLNWEGSVWNHVGTGKAGLNLAMV